MIILLTLNCKLGVTSRPDMNIILTHDNNLAKESDLNIKMTGFRAALRSGSVVCDKADITYLAAPTLSYSGVQVY